MILDDRGEPFHGIIDGLNSVLMRMLRSPSDIIEAIAAKHGVLLARKISTDMGRPFFSMDGAGDSPGCKGSIIKHRFLSIYI